MKVIILILILTAFTFLNAEWELLSSGIGDNLYGVHFTDDDNGYVVGWGASAGAMVLQTSDAGENWNSTNMSTGAFVFSVTSTNANNIYAAGCLNGGAAGAVFKSNNAGGNWINSSFPTTYGLYDVEFADEQIGYTCGWLGKIFKTTNGGSSWSPLNSGTGNVLRWMSVVDENNVFIVGGSNWNNPNTLFKTTNGSTWSYVTSLGGVVGGVHFFDADTGIFAGGSGGEIIKKTYDGGSNWEEKYSSNTGLFQAIYFTEEGIGWACGNNGRVAKSVDFGETWIELDSVSPSTTLLGVYATETHLFAVGENGRIFRKEIETILDANFSAEPVLGEAPLIVQFTDETVGEPSFWHWDFNNDGTTDSMVQHPIWTYSEPGIYSVLLTVYDETQTIMDFELKNDFIEVTSTGVNDVYVPEFEMTNYPNPFNPSTTISFETTNLHEDAQIEIFNLQGQKIKKFEIRNLKSGINEVIWNGDNDSNKPVSSGIYFYKMRNGIYTSTKKMVLLK
ncbi:MAG: T9SS type A sorting domain-containing protein [Candidatus Cloacimonetes bacterium]|nr:T9SS type A sorting domain-containing protein [Candidatus Cloacimonadota bacterium]